MDKRKPPHSPPTATPTSVTGPGCTVRRNMGVCTKAECPDECPKRVAFFSIPRPPWIIAKHVDEVQDWADRHGYQLALFPDLE